MISIVFYKYNQANIFVIDKIPVGVMYHDCISYKLKAQSVGLILWIHVHDDIDRLLITNINLGWKLPIYKKSTKKGSNILTNVRSNMNTINCLANNCPTRHFYIFLVNDVQLNSKI